MQCRLHSTHFADQTANGLSGFNIKHCSLSDPLLHLKPTLSQSYAHHANTHSTAYTTFVTSHTLVISKDTKPTRFPYQFSRMQPKWSCKQALSPKGEKSRNTDRKEEEESEREGGRFLLDFHLYNMLKQGFFKQGTGFRICAYSFPHAPLPPPSH